jgi:hypothetical protein
MNKKEHSGREVGDDEMEEEGSSPGDPEGWFDRRLERPKFGFDDGDVPF